MSKINVTIRRNRKKARSLENSQIGKSAKRGIVEGAKISNPPRRRIAQGLTIYLYDLGRVKTGENTFTPRVLELTSSSDADFVTAINNAILNFPQNETLKTYHPKFTSAGGDVERYQMIFGTYDDAAGNGSISYAAGNYPPESVFDAISQNWRDDRFSFKKNLIEAKLFIASSFSSVSEFTTLNFGSFFTETKITAAPNFAAQSVPFALTKTNTKKIEIFLTQRASKSALGNNSFLYKLKVAGAGANQGTEQDTRTGTILTGRLLGIVNVENETFYFWETRTS